MITAPMLAGTLKDLKDVKYPVLVTPKLDGIRCIVKKDGAFSRNFKIIPNSHVRETLKGLRSTYLNLEFDGELVVPGVEFNGVSSAIMSKDGKPDFRYKIFDVVDMHSPQMNYEERMNLLSKLDLPKFCDAVFPFLVENEPTLLKFETMWLAEGYEGLMLRTPESPYKMGRSTVREGFLLKLKRFEDSEARVMGFVEQMHNENEATKDELGRTKRSSHKANLKGMATLGTLLVKDIHNGKEFGIGTGFDSTTRKLIWDRQRDVIGQIVKYKFQPSGAKDLPRFPVFLGFRDKGDMS